MFDQTKSEFGKETIMKQQKLFGIVMTVCALLLILAGCAPSFDGNRIKNADSYRLDIETMNCTDTHTLELKHGDTLPARAIQARNCAFYTLRKRLP